MQKHEVLKKYFGYDCFREGQEQIIAQIIQKKDVLGIMPTGAGKSICYQIPAVMMEGITLVISPLISLMKDQVNALNEAGIRAAFLNSSLTYPQYCKALQLARVYTYKIIYVAPERLMSEDFLSFAMHMKISMVCVDEAHCVSQWGQDFRPNYLKITDFVEALPQRPIISAFTATATKEVKEDIMHMLHMEDPFTITTGFDRSNLYFAVEKPKDKYKAILTYLHKNPDKGGIIYCLSRKLVEEVCDKLRADGYKATRYHAGLSDKERRDNQDDFIYDRCHVMVATNAFGMGIDKSNVRFVIHYNMPKNMESYYQEAGRAGRDGEDADCILLYGAQDVRLNQFLIEQSTQNENIKEEDRAILQQRDKERLKSMTFYCAIQGCLRHYMLKYFGEASEDYCGNCSNCLTQYESKDVSYEALAILTCVQSLNSRYGLNVLLDTLRGSKNAKVLQYGLDKNPSYGILNDISKQSLRQIMEYLIFHKKLKQSDDDGYATISLDDAQGILQGERMQMQIVKERMEEKQNHSVMDMDAKLFERLRELRMELAKKAHVPPYLIFSDKTLHEMSTHKPANETQMLRVSGVGEVKYKRYGEAFLNVIQKYQQG